MNPITKPRQLQEKQSEKGPQQKAREPLEAKLNRNEVLDALLSVLISSLAKQAPRSFNTIYEEQCERGRLIAINRAARGIVEFSKSGGDCSAAAQRLVDEFLSAASQRQNSRARDIASVIKELHKQGVGFSGELPKLLDAVAGNQAKTSCAR